MVDLDRSTPAPASGPTRGLLVLGHGAGGSIDAPDLVAVRDAAVAAGWAVARVTQPYRVQGRRAPAPAGQLDAAFVAAVVAAHRGMGRRRLPLVVGGRSSGARVAARTAAQVGAVGVVALAFPLHAPGRPEVSRAGEVDPARPTLVVNGDRDAFAPPAELTSEFGGGAPPAGRVTVVVRPGERHELNRDPAGVARVVVAWLDALLATLPAGSGM